MKYKLILMIVVVSLFHFTHVPPSEAQSGGGGGGGGIRSSSGGGGGVARGGGGSSRRSSGPRLTANQQAELQQKQYEQAAELAKRSSEYQQQQALAKQEKLFQEMTENPDGGVSRKYQKQAFIEAKSDYKALRKKEIGISEASQFLETLFLLKSKEFNRESSEIFWPKVLKKDEYSESVQKVTQILGDDPKLESMSSDFQESLSKLATQLAEMAAAGDVSSSDYAHGQKFVSGLSREFTGVSSSAGSASKDSGSGTKPTGSDSK